MGANCLFVLNGNNVMSDNARRSLAAAAVRWNCDYWEYRTGHLAPGYFHSYDRYLALAQPQPWSRVLTLDPDMVIHHQAPSPFSVFPERGPVYGVADCQAERLTPDYRAFTKDNVHRRWLPPIKSALGIHIDEQKYLSSMFSGAFLLFSFPEHKAVVTQFHDWLPRVQQHRSNGHFEQALFNVALHYTQTPTQQVDERWNMISPPREPGPMQGYIYHFTGVDSHAQKPRAATFPWWIG